MSNVKRKHVVFCSAQGISELAPLQILQQVASPGPSEKEVHANCNVKTKTLLAEPLAAMTHPREDGLGTRSKSGMP